MVQLPLVLQADILIYLTFGLPLVSRPFCNLTGFQRNTKITVWPLFEMCLLCVLLLNYIFVLIRLFYPPILQDDVKETDSVR